MTTEEAKEILKIINNNYSDGLKRLKEKITELENKAYERGLKKSDRLNEEADK